MTTKLLILTILQLLVISAFGQEITRQEADSLIIALSKSKGDLERIDLLLNIAQFHIFKPGENKIDLDSAEVYINEAKALAKSVKPPAVQGYLLLVESHLIKEKGKKIQGPSSFVSVESKAMVEKAITILESSDNKSYLGQAYFELSSYYDYTDTSKYSKKVALVQKSIDAFHQGGDLKRKGRSLEMLGDLYILKRKKFTEAITALEEALSIYDSIGHKKVQGVYLLLGDCYRWKQDYGKALTYMLKALKIEKTVEVTPSMQLCQINTLLSSFYHDIDRCDIEVKYVTDALEIAKMHNDQTATFINTLDLALAYCDLHNPEQALEVLRSCPIQEKPNRKAWHNIGYLNAYTQLHQFDAARPHCDTLVMLAEKKVNDYNRFHIYRTVATYFFSMKEYKKARYHLSKCIDIENRAKVGSNAVDISRLLYKLDSVNGDFRSAFANLNAYKTMMDSVTNARKTLQFQVLAVEYEVGMKEDSIKLKDKEISLLTQRNTLQQANLTQAGIIKNITVAGIVLALITIGLLYRQYRQKQKSNNLITLKNGQLQHYLSEKEWLLKEIHHRVKNNLQTIMGLLGTQSRYLRNDIAINAITDSQRRIQSMSLIHQKLYQSNNLSSIRMVDYAHELVDSLSDSFNVGNHVRFNLDINPIELDLAHCIPLGLILNEAITNSFKYAFQNDEQGLISISLKKTSENNYLLVIKDNGPGLPRGFVVERSDSMGMNLMRGLCAEIGAQFILSSQNGTQIEISFAYAPGIAVEIHQEKAEPAMA